MTHLGHMLIRIIAHGGHCAPNALTLIVIWFGENSYGQLPLFGWGYAMAFRDLKQGAHGRLAGFIQRSDLDVPHQSACAFEQAFGIGKLAAIVESEIDMLFLRGDVGEVLS